MEKYQSFGDVMQGAGLGAAQSLKTIGYAATPEAPPSLDSVATFAEENLKRLYEASRKADEIAQHLRPSNTGGGEKASGGGPIGGVIDTLDDQQRRFRSVIGDLMESLARINHALGIKA